MTALNSQSPKVWSGLLRLTHWSLAALVASTLISALVAKLDPGATTTVAVFHVGAGKLLILLLMLRIWLLFFGRGSDRLDALTPTRLELRALFFTPLLRLAQLVLRKRPQRLEAVFPGGTQPRGMREIYRYFFALRGTAPLRAEAHSPLWAPLYLGFFVVLFVELLSGLAWLNGEIFVPGTAAKLHAVGAWVILIFAALHVFSVVYGDWKQVDCGVSAMIHGHRVSLESAGARANGDPSPESDLEIEPEPDPPTLRLREPDPGTETIRTRFQNELM